MTLQQYGPERFDDIALRLIDLAALMREMAEQHREGKVKALALNDRKLREWLGNIEAWAEQARGRQQTEIIRQRGIERAKETSGRGRK